jgi:hypothetical protein
MKIISAFMFSDPDEIELMYAKIVTEDSLVRDWIVVEGSYSFRGDPKPLILNQMIQKDKRFKRFLPRIHVVEVTENFISDFKYDTRFLIRKQIEIMFRKMFFSGHELQKRLLLEKKFFYAENHSRNAAIPSILQITKSDQDWVLISDVDEILNSENHRIRKSLTKIMKLGDLFVLLYRQKFVFDYDNLDSQQRFTPFISIKLLKNMSNPSLSVFRSRFDGVPQVKYPYVSEFTFCFQMEAVLRKYAMFPHIAPPMDAVLEGLEENRIAVFKDSSIHDIRWYNKVVLSEYFVPNYIVKNFRKLKTNNISDNFRSVRVSKHPTLFN